MSTREQGVYCQSVKIGEVSGQLTTRDGRLYASCHLFPFRSSVELVVPSADLGAVCAFCLNVESNGQQIGKISRIGAAQSTITLAFDAWPRTGDFQIVRLPKCEGTHLSCDGWTAPGSTDEA